MTFIHLICKRLRIHQLPLSHHLSTAISIVPHPRPFNENPCIRFANFCNQTAVPFTTTPDRGVVTEFLINKCGLTYDEITKAFRYNKPYRLRAKSTQNLEENLELLNGCGFTTPVQIRKVVISSTDFLFAKSEGNIKSKLSLLRAFMKEEDLYKVLIRKARVFTYQENKFKSAISVFQRLGIEDRALSELVAIYPPLLACPEEKIMESVKLAEHLGLKKGSKMFAAAMRIILCVPKETIDMRLQCLSSSGFSEKQILQLSPWVVGHTEEKLKHHIDFLVNYVGLSLDDFVTSPTLFSYSLEKRIIPRYRVLEALKSMQGLKTETSFRIIVAMSEKRFLEKFVNSNHESSSILRDIYHGGKAGKWMIDKDSYKCVSQ